MCCKNKCELGGKSAFSVSNLFHLREANPNETYKLGILKVHVSRLVLYAVLVFIVLIMLQHDNLSLLLAFLSVSAP